MKRQPHVSTASEKPTAYISTSSDGTQTESTFYPHAGDIKKAYSAMAVRQYEEMRHLRDAIKVCMTEVGLSIYDINAYKDVVLVMQHQLPDMPVTDLLLSSSKLFRRGSELARLLSCFFNVCFAEDFVDEHFSFTEIRLAKKEIQTLRLELERAKRERDMIQVQHDKLHANSVHHSHSIRVLESRNDILELRSSALEDQMAILFQQISEDFRASSQGFIQQSADDLDVQEELSATRAAFITSVESVQQRMYAFQNVIVDIQEDPMLAGSDSGFKNKVKSLDVHVQYIINRFASVKDGLSQVAAELIASIDEKRKVLNFALQHLRLYDCQSGKMRLAKASLHDIRQRGSDIEKMVQHTFASGCIVRIERSGEITVEDTKFTAGGGNERSKYVLSNIRVLQEAVQRLMESTEQVTTALDNEDEQRVLLKTISMSVPSQGRTDVKQGSSAAIGGPGVTAGSGGAGGIRRPTGEPGYPGTGAHGRPSGAAGGGGGGDRGGGNMGHHQPSSVSSLGAASNFSGNEMDLEAIAQAVYDLQKQRDELSSKVAFLKQVYEERIADLEQKNERGQRRVYNLTMELNKKNNQENIKREAQEKEMLLRAKEVWGDARDDLQEQSRASRMDAFGQLGALGKDARGGADDPNQSDGTQLLLRELGGDPAGRSRFKSTMGDSFLESGDDQLMRSSIVVPTTHRFPTLTSTQRKTRDKQAEILRVMRRLNLQSPAPDKPAGQ